MPHRLSSTELEEIARSSYKQGSLDSAFTTVEQAINASKSPVASQYDLRAAVKEKMGDLDAALRHAKALLRTFENDARGYLRAARIMERMNKPNNAALIYERGLKMVPEAAIGYRIMADNHKRLVLLLLPDTKCDPIRSLPLEIVEMILLQLTFRQRTLCTGVARSWRQLLHSLPGLWTDLDLSRAIKPVNVSFISLCVNQSRHRMHSATLFRVAKLDLVLATITSRCNHLKSLNISHVSPNMELLVSSLSLATRLTHLSLTGFPLKQSILRAILKNLPQLISLSAEELLGERSIAAWAEIPPNLRSLTLRAASKQPAPYIFLAGIVSHCPNLQRLILSGWEMVHGAPELDLVNQKKLEVLHVVGTGVLTLLNLPESISELNLGCSITAGPHLFATTDVNTQTALPNLDSLTCRTMNDVLILTQDWTPSSAGLSYLSIPAAELAVNWTTSALSSPRLATLSELKLCGARNADSELIPLILRSMKHLKALDLSSSDVTGVGVRLLVEGLEGLMKLRVTYCNDLSVDAIEWARAKGIDVDCHWEKQSSGARSGRGIRYGA